VADAVIEGKQLQEERQKGQSDLGMVEEPASSPEAPQAV
jgi:hypothetical protein